MQIKLKTHYSVKILIHLALHARTSEQLLDIKSIASDLDIKYEHCKKIIQNLVHLGYLVSYRGHNGGVKINHSIDNIHLYDLILAVEEVDLSEFKHDCTNCNMPIDCKFRHLLKEQYKIFYQSFYGVYLSDLIC